MGLSCFFQCNRHLREKILLALRSYRLLDVCPDRCAGANELFRQHPLPLIQLESTASFDYADCKGKTLLQNDITPARFIPHSTLLIPHSSAFPANSFLIPHFAFRIRQRSPIPHFEFHIPHSAFLSISPSALLADSFHIPQRFRPTHSSFHTPNFAFPMPPLDLVIQFPLCCRTGGAPWLLCKCPPDWTPTS